MSKPSVYRVIFATLIVLALPVSAAAGNSIRITDVTENVEYSDLNLNSEAGAKALYARLQRASIKACDLRSFHVLGSIERYAEAQVCVDATLTAAIRKIDSAKLSKVHNS